MKAEAVVVEIHIEMIANADAPNVHTTMIDPSSWQQDSQHPMQNKTGTSPDPTTDATTAERAETVEEIVETIAATRVATVTGEGKIEPQQTG